MMRSSAPLCATLGAVFTVMFVGAAAAQKESIIMNFGHYRGHYPNGRLLMDSAGHLFATNELGGPPAHYIGGRLGTAVELTRSGKSWTATVLHTFDLVTGGFLTSGFIADKKGTLYGTTELGGDDGCGMVFSLEPKNGAWTESPLHNFSYGGDGCVPNGELVRDAKGNLYGVAAIGGADGDGIVFELTKSKSGWTESILYNFTGGADGNRPRSILMDKSGAIFGLASQGGAYGDGVLFELANDKGSWTETALHSFGGSGDGTGTPYGALAEDANGDLYGTTISGGENGQGSVFELSPSNGGWTSSTLYSFTGGADGQTPEDGVTLAAGALYGTTSAGGATAQGTVFELSNQSGSWTETVLHSFAGGHHDGSLPFARPILDKSGVLYGTTIYGGNQNKGIAYQIAP